jgi:hypothetical protein
MECVDLIDADGTFRHYPYPGARREQPAYDMDVLNDVRREWVRLRNEQNAAAVAGGRP